MTDILLRFLFAVLGWFLGDKLIAVFVKNSEAASVFRMLLIIAAVLFVIFGRIPF